MFIYIQQTLSDMSIYLESCFWSPEKCRFNVHSNFCTVFGLHLLLREICGSFAAQRPHHNLLTLSVSWFWSKNSCLLQLEILTKLDGRCWTDVFDVALHHHHRNNIWVSIFLKNGVQSCSREHLTLSCFSFILSCIWISDVLYIPTGWPFRILWGRSCINHQREWWVWKPDSHKGKVEIHLILRCSGWTLCAWLH